MELDRMRVGPELDAERIGLHDGDREVAGLELAGGHVAPPLAERKPERLAVELCRALVILGRHCNEVDPVQQLCSVVHAYLPSSLTQLIIADSSRAPGACPLGRASPARPLGAPPCAAGRRRG